MLLGIICLNSCTQVNYNNCPEYPVAGAKGANELKKLDDNNFVNTWEWIGRINKLRQELELCK